MENKSNIENQRDNIINEIKRKSKDGDYIYRGERRPHDDVSSALYREYSKHINIGLEGFNLTYAQKEMLKIAKNHMGESPVGPLEDFENVTKANKHFTLDWEESLTETIKEVAEREILTELQHYGGKTNLIDFTTDYLIAIYFACSGEPKVDGRVILLEKTEEIEKMTIRPRNPRHRVIAQKSVFLHPPKGFIDVPNDNIVSIPFGLKRSLLEYLRQYHGISTETIYNDIHGFIRNQNIQKNAYVQFYLGLTLQYRGYHAEPGTEKQQAYKDAIVHYDEAIEMNFELEEVAYSNRGECWLHLEECDNAKTDFTTAINMGYDIIDSFRNDYKDVADFEKRTGLTMPLDLAEMLGG